MLKGRVLCVLACSWLVLGSTSAWGQEEKEAEEPPAIKEIKVGESRLTLYGFVRFDAIYDDSRSSAIQTPTFIRSEDPQVGVEDEDSFNFHPRLTRFGGDLQGPRIEGLGNAKLSAKIEIDFQNGGRESRQLMRMRQGWLKLAWDNDWSVLLGQSWDMISPLYPTVNNDTMMWNAGNLGDRRPQVRFAYSPDGEGTRVSFTGGLGLTGAIDDQDLDGDGVRDGDDAAMPSLQARVGVSVPAGSRRANFGVSGHFGEEEVTLPVGGEDNFESWSTSLDYEIPLASRTTLKGEVWTGENLSDVRGGIGQGINTVLGREIESAGGWTEVGFGVTDVYSVYFGYTVDDPQDEDIPFGGRTKNDAWYVVNRFRFGKALLLGIDYLNWTTEFQGLADGDDNRFNAYAVYTF